MSEPPTDGISSSDDGVECFQGSNTDLESKLPPVKSNYQFESSERPKVDDNSSENEMCVDEEQSADEANSESEEASGIRVSYETDTVSASPAELSKSTYSGIPSISGTSFEFQGRKMASKKQTPPRFGPSPASHSINLPTTNSSCEGDSRTAAISITDNKNLMFYQNRICSMPDGDFIENILKEWKDDFEKLENHHGYIQWLFPTKERGLNHCAQILNDDEAEIIKRTPVLRNRFLRAYKMMLAFFGMKLENEMEGTIGQSKLYSSRIAHLNRSQHNNLRITRILKALGELGYEHFKKPFVLYLFYEAFQKKTLENCRESCFKYWIPTIKDENTRKMLENLAIKIKSNETAFAGRKHCYY